MDVSDKAMTLRAQEHGHQPIVIYDARGNGEGGVAPTITGDHNGHISDYTSVVVMSIEARHEEPRCYEDGTSPAIIARAGTGGVIPRLSCLAVDSHPSDSRIRIVDGPFPSLTVKMAKLSCDGPLVLIRRDK